MIINGVETSWDEITREQLRYLVIDEKLSTTAIARMFSVTASKVQYKKSKFKLTGSNFMYECFVKENEELFGSLNENSKEWLFDSRNIDLISKAITQYVFRNGPIEAIHGKCKDFSQEDMKEINIYMVNHIAGLLTYALNGNWLQLRILLSYFDTWSKEWNPAEAETDKIDNIFYDNFNLSDYKDKIPFLTEGVL